jgi:hypothetical protein
MGPTYSPARRLSCTPPSTGQLCRAGFRAYSRSHGIWPGVLLVLDAAIVLYWRLQAQRLSSRYRRQWRSMNDRRTAGFPATGSRCLPDIARGAARGTKAKAYRTEDAEANRPTEGQTGQASRLLAVAESAAGIQLQPGSAGVASGSVGPSQLLGGLGTTGPRECSCTVDARP